MKLTILGCWAPYPRAGGACSGYLLETEDQNLMLDCGNGALSNLFKHLDVSQLNGLIITHFHPDHYVDVFSLRHALKASLDQGARQLPLDLWIPTEPAQVFDQLLTYQDVFTIHRLEELTGPILWGQVRMGVYRTKHPLPTYALKFTEHHANCFVYTADTAWEDGLINWSRGAQTLLMEASLQQKDVAVTKVGHLTSQQAGSWGAQIGAQRLILTHFWPEYDLKVTAQEAGTAFAKEIMLASEGQIYTF